MSLAAKSPRGRMLVRACALTTGDRNATYGEPFDNMSNFADLLEGYFRMRGWITENTSAVTAEDAAWIMVLAKMARTAEGSLPAHPDNYIDAAAYAAMAGECSLIEREETTDAGYLPDMDNLQPESKE